MVFIIQKNDIMILVIYMDTNNRIQELMDQRGWTAYRLAEKAGLSQSTVINIFRRNTVPSIATLECICEAFGISLSEFFCEENGTEQPREEEIIALWNQLDVAQRDAVIRLLKAMQ